MALLHRQLQSGEYPNCRKLAEELEVASKTIQRDIEFMRDQLGLPIQYDRARLGFYYTAPVTAFPTMEVSAGELVALFVAQKALRQFHGTVFEKSLAAAFRRLEQQWEDKISFDWADLDDAISFHKIGTTTADLRAFEQISQAVLQNRELVFEYRKLEGAVFEHRRLQPYHLGSIEHQWYVIGHDLDRRQLRTFALTRMRRPRMTKGTFRRPDDFSIQAHLKESFGVFAGGRNRHTVRLRFAGAAARLVAERQWHPSQAVKPLPGDALELSFQLCSLREIERWILSWGPRVEVLAPPALVERIQKTVSEMAKRQLNEKRPKRRHS
jgi:proteasome accessory factor B